MTAATENRRTLHGSILIVRWDRPHDVKGKTMYPVYNEFGQFLGGMSETAIDTATEEVRDGRQDRA